jgi:hypothetical protein
MISANRFLRALLILDAGAACFAPIPPGCVHQPPLPVQ